MTGSRTMAVRSAGLTVALAVALLAGSAARGDIIYTNDFEGAVGGEWSSTTTDTTPSGRKFLGQFVNNTVTLNLSGLAAHSDLNLSLDLYLIRAWDGNHPAFGAPDTF